MSFETKILPIFHKHGYQSARVINNTVNISSCQEGNYGGLFRELMEKFCVAEIDHNNTGTTFIFTNINNS